MNSATFVFVAVSVLAAPKEIRLDRPAPSTAAFDYHELTLRIEQPDARNCFTDAALTGTLKMPSGRTITADGFCDDLDGTVFRIRFMPVEAGRHDYTLEYRQGNYRKTFSGRFTAEKPVLPGIVQNDPEHPFHFVWSGNREHYFYNGMTTYWLLGVQDDKAIRAAVDRLARHRITRIRVALNARTADGGRWKEPQVKPSAAFRFRVEPWPAARPDSVEDPGYNVSRFHLETFRKAERLLAAARDRSLVVSLIFHLDGADKGVDPFGKAGMGGPDEQRYYRYTVARLAAFSNVMWDITNEWHLFRSEAWVNSMGELIRSADPYGHLISVHGNARFPFRNSPWAGFALYQSWDEHGSYAFMLKNRREQQAAGRAIPQVNEEYGYEDHYPFPWGEGRKPPARIADNRRRLAWEMYMAGGYQTSGERADVPGMGGWITGLGNSEMTLPEAHAHMTAFFTSVPWWTADPHPELATNALCLGDPGKLYLVYLPKSTEAAVEIGPGEYVVRRFNPRSGSWLTIAPAKGGRWVAPQDGMPDDDWAFVLTARR